MKKSINILIRADANALMGTGHVMRCLALAQAWQDAGGSAIFAFASESPAIEARLESEGVEIVHLSAEPGSAEDAAKTAGLASEREAAWMVVDGYHFGSDYQNAVKSSEVPLLSIDDYGHSSHYFADLVLNQNLHAHQDLYASRESFTRLLLGTRYVLLRREFLNWKGWRRAIPETAQKVLITLGGGDPNNVTLKVIEALRKAEVDGLEAVVVVGPSNPNFEQLHSAARGLKVPIHLESNVEDMPKLMAWADMAVSAGGTTSWETAFMGLPSLMLVLAENQEWAAKTLAERGAAVNLGRGDAVTEDVIARELSALAENGPARLKLSTNGSKLVDGLGVKRVLETLLVAV